MNSVSNTLKIYLRFIGGKRKQISNLGVWKI